MLQSIAHLLHFAGCTLASLHPEPLSSFTARDISLDDDDDDNDEKAPPARPGDDDKEDQFTKYAEAYFTTLNVRSLALFACFC